MNTPNTSQEVYQLIAQIADLCFKPWKHAVINQSSFADEYLQLDDPIELVIRIECRSAEGKRNPENDLDLEIYRSGTDLNLMIGWCNQLDLPILWQGKHSVWMDANNGMRCKAPKGGDSMESFSRRLRALFAE